MRTTWVVLGLLASAGCMNQEREVGASAASIAQAPQTATLGGIPLAIDGEVWRNQMPGPTENDVGLFVSVRVHTVDNSPMPASIRADTAWVLKGSDRWVTPLTPVSREALGTSFEAAGERGPKWDPGESVEIVAVIRDGLDNRVLIRVADKTIESAQ